MRSHISHTGTYAANLPAFTVRDKVHVIGKAGTFQVAAAYRLECWNVYALSEFPGFFINEDRLIPVRPGEGDAQI